MEKNFSLLVEKIKILRERGMDIPKSSTQKNIIRNYNYYNLINAYKDPFLFKGSSTTEKYLPGTQLSELESLLIFDTNLRLIFLKELLRIEEVIKNQIVQSFYEYHLYSEPDNSEVEKSNLHRDSEYLRRKYYDLSTKYSVNKFDDYGVISTSILTKRPYGKCSTLDRQTTYDTYISTVYRTLGQQRKNKNESIKMYLEQHGYMPMWILMNVLTFGNVSHLFTLQKEKVQIEIIKKLNLLTRPSISNDHSIINTSRIFQILSIYRNICAHNERFYLTQTKVPIDDIYMNFGLKLPHYVNPLMGRRLNKHKKNKRLEARQGIYGLLFAISLFLTKEELNRLIDEIKNEMKLLEGNLKTIAILDIERSMGLDFNWHELILK